MDNARAKEVLEGMGLDALSHERLRNASAPHLFYIKRINAGNHTIRICGTLNAEQLQAIALWMQDPEGVTNAGDS